MLRRQMGCGGRYRLYRLCGGVANQVQHFLGGRFHLKNKLANPVYEVVIQDHGRDADRQAGGDAQVGQPVQPQFSPPGDVFTGGSWMSQGAIQKRRAMTPYPAAHDQAGVRETTVSAAVQR